MASRCLNANGRSPPDHGWSWVVLAASFLNIIITDGICFTFGVFLPEIMNSFQSSKGVTSWAMSLVIGVCLLVGKFNLLYHYDILIVFRYSIMLY